MVATDKEHTMRVLVTHGSKMGGTEGLAVMLGDALRDKGFDVDVRSAKSVQSVAPYDGVIVGGALYAGRWHRDTLRFVSSRRRDLQDMPVWLFSTGPLDDSAARKEIKPVAQVARLMERIGARGHMTFGGRLVSDPPGFMARAMAKKMAGDWRDPEHVRRWATQIADQLRLRPAA